MENISSAIECLLFVSGEPVEKAELARALEVEIGEIEQGLAELKDALENRGIRLVVTTASAQLGSNPEYYDAVERLLSPAVKRSASRSLMETLSLVAYRQPITRAEIENIRGVRCNYAIGQLLRLGLIYECGKKETVGRPALLATTDAFLHKLGISSLDELPRVEAEDFGTV